MHNTTNVGLRRTIQNNNVISSTTTRKKTTQRKRRNNGRTTTTGRVDVSRVRFKRICSKGKTNSPTIIYFSTLQKFHKCTLTHTQQPNNHSPSTTLICLALKKTLTSIPSHSVSVNTLTQHKIPLTMELPYYRHYCLSVVVMVGNLALVLSLLFFLHSFLVIVLKTSK